MTTRESEVTGPRRELVRISGVVAVGFLVCALLGPSLSVWVVFGIGLVTVLVADLVALAGLARRSTRRKAVRCGIVALAALLIQAGGVYLGLWLITWFSFSGSGWLFWTSSAVALATSALLLGRRATRAYGWAVLLGSIEGFFAFAGLLVTAITACNCLD